MMQRIIKTIVLPVAFSGQLLAEDKKEVTAYQGAFDTFYKYIETLNKYEMTSENIINSSMLTFV